MAPVSQKGKGTGSFAAYARESHNVFARGDAVAIVDALWRQIRNKVTNTADYVAMSLAAVYSDDKTRQVVYDAATLQQEAAMLQVEERLTEFGTNEHVIWVPTGLEWECDVCYELNHDGTSTRCYQCGDPRFGEVLAKWHEEMATGNRIENSGNH